MLILDVKTRWSSTHQIMHTFVVDLSLNLIYILIIKCYPPGRALDFSKEIDDFVGWHCDLRSPELDADDWSAISLVAGWLKAFHSATTQMSRMKQPMLSTIHAIFRGLQDHICSTLAELSDSAPAQLRDGLVDAHQKLSEYYYRSDESPFYTWAASMYY